MLTVLHASDLQCGRPFRPRAADALIRLAEESAPDVVVVSGDLTQRAKKSEYALAASILERLPAPYVVTPGNHDVPLFRVWERMNAPHRNWKAAISSDLDTVTRVEGATFVALDSTAPHRTLVNGRLEAEQLDFARRAFDAAPAGDLRILVVHHHFVPVPDGTDGMPLPHARALVGAFEAMGVAFVLGGHVHQTHVTTSSDLLGAREGPGIPLIACGTTTSWRGRGAERGLNSLNLLRVGDGQVEVVPHVMTEHGSAFEPRQAIVLPLAAGSGAAGAGKEGAP